MLLSLGFLHCCIGGERCYFLHVGYLLKGKGISKSYHRGQKYLSDRFRTSSLTSCLQSFLTISASSGRSSLGLCWCQHRVCLELCPESICLEAVLEILSTEKVLRNPSKKTAHSRNCHGERKCCTKRAGLGPQQQAVPEGCTDQVPAWARLKIPPACPSVLSLGCHIERDTCSTNARTFHPVFGLRSRDENQLLQLIFTPPPAVWISYLTCSARESSICSQIKPPIFLLISAMNKSK